MKWFSARRAKKILDDGASQADEQQLEDTLAERQKILDKVVQSRRLAPYLNQVSILFQLLQDYVRGNYREIPWWTLGAIATALTYILIPLDAIPDAIPVAGFIDDVAVLKLCLELVSKDLDSYRRFRDARDSIEEPVLGADDGKPQT